ncbi:predicted protein [Sclerotinia sclerotiorum 1980 UF-70]|uniref:Uncharacterized protein n=1 Tax=Sclerotinia sclerotiorum (strain ATCC 18683 / 1980 / Ss-1) TaxID=665079 RepID=A7EKX2_SCLS1|nr:predicted protein [Sclerotinia sclerotiorum 1980 UF-70]EDO03488.1 predicted protein [Sclerotinia sclerotiorum 1980 UF-70]
MSIETMDSKVKVRSTPLLNSLRRDFCLDWMYSFHLHVTCSLNQDPVHESRQSEPNVSFANKASRSAVQAIDVQKL